MSLLLAFQAYNVDKKTQSDTEDTITSWWVWSALAAMLLSTALLWLPTWWTRRLNVQREVMVAAWGVWVILVTLTLWKVTTHDNNNKD
jgi:high-affinity Fe2+/Pb2+ permease